jgi:hypothetical protein
MGQGCDVEKERCWQKVIREAVRSGTPIRESCRQRQSRENQLYWWEREGGPG